MSYFSCLAMEIKYKFRVPSVLPTSDMQLHIERFNNFACVPSTFVYFRHEIIMMNVIFKINVIIKIVSLKKEKLICKKCISIYALIK